jgi:hypothetical protein
MFYDINAKHMKFMNDDMFSSLIYKIYRVQDYSNTPHTVIDVLGFAFYSDGKYLHDRIISLRGQVWAHKTNLIPSHVIKVHVPSKGCERSCISVLFGSVLSLFL